MDAVEKATANLLKAIDKAARRTEPPITRQPGQVSLDLPSYLIRLLPQWITPQLALAEMWRGLVYNQPIAMICRETLIANILALSWKIQPKESTERDELKDEIKYYTNLLEESNGIEYSTHV